MQKTLSVCLCLGLLSVTADWAGAQTRQSPGQQQKAHKPRPKSVATHQSVARTAPRAKVPSAGQGAVAATLVQPLEPAALQVAEQVHTGTLPCELVQSVSLSPDHRSPGYFRVQGPGFRYHMRPVASRTGVIRLEDEKAGGVWLQLADKSMLMDQKKGRRLADACAHPQQLAAAAQMQLNPPPALFEIDKDAHQD